MTKIGFIGAGNMATAIINGLISNKASNPDNINIFDLDAEKINLMTAKGVNALASSQDVVKNSDIIVLAVKPQNYAEVLDTLSAIDCADKVFVTGDFAECYLKGAGDKAFSFADKESLAKALEKEMQADDVVLVKGSYGTKMWQVIEYLLGERK